MRTGCCPSQLSTSVHICPSPIVPRVVKRLQILYKAIDRRDVFSAPAMKNGKAYATVRGFLPVMQIQPFCCSSKTSTSM